MDSIMVLKRKNSIKNIDNSEKKKKPNSNKMYVINK